jgi:hypothetical protein
VFVCVVTSERNIRKKLTVESVIVLILIAISPLSPMMMMMMMMMMMDWACYGKGCQ